MATPSPADASASQAPPSSPIAVVAPVASAGGLGALSSVLRRLPEDFGAAVVVAQHLGAQGSTLVPILDRRIALPVDWASEGARVEPGRVLVCPPRSILEIFPDGTCGLHPSLGTVAENPLDLLLSSIADSFGAQALGVVLTGMGRDGAAGTAALKRAGGAVIAQSEESAEQPSMPRAAAEAGADLILPIDGIGPMLVDTVQGEPLPRPPEEIDAIVSTFGASGEVATLAREIDWGLTPLGPVLGWPPLLRSMMRLAMTTERPAGLVWGDEHVWFVNDGAIPILGHDAVRQAFGRPYRDGSPALGDDIVPILEQARAGTSVLQAQTRVVLPRHGRLVETWYDISYTGVFEPDGDVAGVYFDFFDRTTEVLAARRLSTLNSLARASRGRHRREALGHALEVLRDAPDVQFAAAYLLVSHGLRLALASAVGIDEGTAMTPPELPLDTRVWPFRRVVETGEPLLVTALGERFRGQLLGAEHSAPDFAVVHPLRDTTSNDVVGALVLGVAPHVPFDGVAQEFLALTAETIGARVSEAHVAHRNRERVERLGELDRVKTEFFSNVSHEIRTPLTLMLAPLDDLLGDGRQLAPSVRQELQLIRRNAQRLLRLVGSMLDFSQIDERRRRAHFVPTDLSERTRDIVTQFQSAANGAGLELRLDLDLHEPVWVDLDMWEKIVSNLLSNALKFTFDGEIEISLHAQPKHAELIVRDTGVGIPADELPHVFERFHRVTGTRARSNEGTGIGLALVDELVRRHHGRVRVTSAVGEGTTFTVWMPLGERVISNPTADAPVLGSGFAAALAEEALTWDTRAETDHTPSVGPDDDAGRDERDGVDARLLVVDDNRDLRDYLVRLLGERWDVVTASDGEQALRMAREHPPDLVVADVMMPGLDGFQLVTELRLDEALRTTPVVLLTARAGEEAAIEGLLAGADDYVVKPFSAKELVARIGGQLELARIRQYTERLDAFRLRISDELRALDDPWTISETACRLLAEHLGVDDARFVAADDPTLDASIAQAITTGKRLVLDGTLVFPVGGGAFPATALVVEQRAVRQWTPEEVALAAETAGRAGAEMTRARAEMLLRERTNWLRGQGEALEAALNGAPLETSLGILVRTAVSALGEGTRAAFYLADHDGTALHHLVGMSDTYAEAVDGFVIGPESLACGLATHRGMPVVTPDVMEDPLWERWRWLATEHDYRGCWSFPVHTSGGELVGSLALYSCQPRQATDDDLELASLLTQTASIIISQHTESAARRRAEAALRHGRPA